MNILPEDWQSTSGTYAQDRAGDVWRIIGFIDRPAVILERLGEASPPVRETVIMGSPHSKEWVRLIPEKIA